MPVVCNISDDKGTGAIIITFIPKISPIRKVKSISICQDELRPQQMLCDHMLEKQAQRPVDTQTDYDDLS